jgi:hypothetical protein
MTDTVTTQQTRDTAAAGVTALSGWAQVQMTGCSPAGRVTWPALEAAT